MWKHKIKSKEFLGGVGTLLFGLGTTWITGGFNPSNPDSFSYWTGIGITLIGVLLIIWSLVKHENVYTYILYGKYKNEWEHHNNLVALLINLTKCGDSDIKDQLDKIELERISINDNEYQTLLNLYLDAEDERIDLGMKYDHSILRDVLNKLLKRMYKRYAG